MDTSKYLCTHYTIHVQADNYGNTILEMNLRELMQNRLNFIKEERLSQTNVNNMGDCIDHIIVDQNPKCHTKIFSESI